MNTEPIIAIEARQLHRSSEASALAAFDEIIGTATHWGSRLVRRRMGSESQRDWVVEAGHWMLTAKRYGFADDIKRRLNGARKVVTNEVDPNDPAQTNLHQQLAPAMVVHYFTATGWSFAAWEPPQRPGEDIDVVLVAPGGSHVAIQVKGSDQPGYQGTGRIRAGEDDERVRHGITKAANQLPRPARQATMIVMSAHRTWPLSGTPYAVTPMLLGNTIQYAGSPAVLDERWLLRSGRPLGKLRDWPHVGAVVLLDYRRGADRFDYGSTVILNPWAAPLAACHLDWFPNSRVLHLAAQRFRWLRGGPTGCVPDGTLLVTSDGGA